MAAMHEPMSDVDLDEDARRLRQRELELQYHHLPVHRLEKERELREVVLPPTPTQHRHVINGSGQEQHRHSADREYPVDVHGAGHVGQPATLTVSEQHVVHQQQQQPHFQEEKTTKKQKRVGFGGFGGFGRKGHSGDGQGEGREGDHHVHGDMGYGKNGATSSHTTYGQGHPVDYEKGTTLTVYPNYLKRPPGILRIVQLLVGVIVCAAVNAERCISNSINGIVCASASSPYWYGILGGQGFVLFVAILFIFGNFALIFYHICTRPRHVSTTAKESPFSDKFRLGEMAYDAAAVVLYIIAASVEAWYASWTYINLTNQAFVGGIGVQSVRNVYRPQWIAAAVFAWLNVILYAVSIVFTFLFR